MSELFEKNRKAVDAGSLASLKVPPHSVEAEQAVLGGLMLDNTVWDTVAEKLIDEDFFRHEHQLIFRVMFSQTESNKPLDVVTLVEALDSRGELDGAGGIRIRHLDEAEAARTTGLTIGRQGHGNDVAVLGKQSAKFLLGH